TVDAARFDFAQPDTFAPAYAGVKRMFLLRPPAISDVKRYLFPAIDAAQASGVEHIVFLSLLGVENNRVVPHYKVEKYLESCGVAYTFVRPSFFMQNLNTTHRSEIRDESEICVPVGRGKTSFIDARDIGAVAALALAEDGHTNRAYELTGSEALDYYEVAAIFSDVLGRPITYANPSILRFVRAQRRKGAPLKFALVMIGLYTSTRFGMAKTITNEVERLLGRPPITLRQYVQDYRECWIA
ncbi:MAG: SDR family oxidoreductase, partial [Chloroflexi bacterium]|nr:SDR family oxidoreductase [Chloroflexota bacterium]